MDAALDQMRMVQLSPVLNEPRPPEYWLEQPGAPKAERPPDAPLTATYDELILHWKQTERDQS
jgi:glycerol transport system substrate-binding protein